MHNINKKIFLILSAIFVIAFLLFIIPNSKASDNLAMVSMFEPDEGVCLPVVQNMIFPKGDFITFLKKFVFYDFYSYGFPFFAASSLAVFPLQWCGQINNTPLVMLVLRQAISVFPMLIALLLLVYMQDRFRTYRSIVLFILLISIPAIIQNGLWWHPDGLAFLLAALVIFLLWKDDRRFGWLFFMASVTCGVLVATKMVGVYFFLAVGMTFIWGFIEKKISLKKLLLSSLGFLVIMAVSFIVANPFLLSGWARSGYFFTMNLETRELTQGYGLIYEKGLSVAWPLMRQFYGEAIFLLLTIGVTIWGLWRKEQCFLYALTLAWFIPLTLSLLLVTHFKYQYWLPVAVPLISNLALLLPANPADLFGLKKHQVIRNAFLLLLAIQFVLFVIQDVNTIVWQAHRHENNPRIQFFEQAATYLDPLMNEDMKVYYDYRLYVPQQTGWEYKTSYDVLTYPYIEKQRFDILFLLESRMLDYLNPNAIGVEPQKLEKAHVLYQDALSGTISGYHLLYRDDTAGLYILNETYEEHYIPCNCN